MHHHRPSIAAVTLLLTSKREWVDDVIFAMLGREWKSRQLEKVDIET